MRKRLKVYVCVMLQLCVGWQFGYKCPMHCSKREVDCLGRNGKRTLNQERYRDNDFQEIAEVTGVL